VGEVADDVIGQFHGVGTDAVDEGGAASSGERHAEDVDDPLELMFSDEQAWWRWTGTTGGGLRALDPLPEDARATYRDGVFERMQSLRTPTGYPMTFQIECVLARC
jgi:hypothetical protein